MDYNLRPSSIIIMVFESIVMKALILIFSLIVVSCSSVPVPEPKPAVAPTDYERQLLDVVIGQDPLILKEKERKKEGKMTIESPKYGTFLGSYPLPKGGKVMRYISSAIDKEYKSFRVRYFNVGNDNKIRDWASGIYIKQNKDEPISGRAIHETLLTSTGYPVTEWEK